MKKKIEIYVRKSGDKNLLMLHIPEKTKEHLINGIKNGKFEKQDVSIYLELTLLKEWKSEENPDHVKIEISEIAANYAD